MPRRKKAGKRAVSDKDTTPKRTINNYFPPSPASSSSHSQKECTESTTRKLCHDVKAEISVLPTPDNSPEKTPEKPDQISTDIKPHVNDIPEQRIKQETDRKEPVLKNKSIAGKQNLVTDFFEVRKSSRRKTAKQIQRELESTIRTKIRQGCEHGLEIRQYEGKGRGVAATQPFSKGDFVVEYIGQLMEIKEAKNREEEYRKDTSKGCYMYFFNHRDRRYCIDATAESGKIGRLLNHSRSKPNCVTKSVDVDNQSRLILIALRDISSDEELLYDYGDRSKEALDSNPWLKD